MFDYMEKYRLLESMEINRAAWDALLSQLEPEYLEVTLEGGRWTVKDIVAHIMCYEAWVGSQIYPELREHIPVPPEDVDMLDTDQRDDWYYWLHHERLIEDILADAGWYFEMLYEGVSACSEEDLNTPVRLNEFYELEVTDWEDTTADPLWPLWKWIAFNCYEHYPQHIIWLKLWFDMQLGLYAPPGMATSGHDDTDEVDDEMVDYEVTDEEAMSDEMPDYKVADDEMMGE
ncbi:MAG: hypothetical protein JXB30_01225 [Anaerolineae bacterium]|nr:hypothetical protein [Anaerolineae bacterium]